jgi:uncharacterized protein
VKENSVRVIITGGTGLIGRALTHSLSADGHEVIVLSRNPRRSAVEPDAARVVAWDGSTGEGWGSLMEGADAIVNLAGENIGGGLWTASRKQRILDSRLNAGQAILQALKRADRKPRVLVQASGIGYYGAHGDEPLTESDPPGHDWLAQVAVAWEGCTQSAEALGVRRVVIRTAGVLDSKEGFLPRMLIPFRLFVGGQLGGGQQWLPWIHLADEVRAIRFLIDQPQASGVFNLTAPVGVRNAEFGRTLGHVLGRPSLVPAPAFALRLALGELSSLVLGGQHAIPSRLTELGFTFRFPDLEPALRDVLRRGTASI